MVHHITYSIVYGNGHMAMQFGNWTGTFWCIHVYRQTRLLRIVRELGPVLTALLVGGRVGAGFTVEIGTMAVTEQIDAIRCLGASPIRKLVMPRVVAMTFIMPLLTLLADFRLCRWCIDFYCRGWNHFFLCNFSNA